MQTSSNGISLIKLFEGCRLTAYRDITDIWTIGYGHTSGVKQGMTITQAQADDYLKSDLIQFEKYVNATGLHLNQNQFDALVSFTYNCGPGNLTKLIKNRNLQQIADAILYYNKAGGREVAGLTRRRKAERDLYIKPINQVTNDIKPKLPYKVQTTANLNIRTGPSTKHTIIRLAKKGEILTVWAIETKGNMQWGKNGKEYFCLNYCRRI